MDVALVLLNIGVISILDHMFCPASLEKFGNECPFGAMLNNVSKELAVLLLVPFVAVHFRAEVVEPLLSALLRSSEVELLRSEVEQETYLAPN